MANAILSSAEVEAYQRDGFLKPSYRLAEATSARLRELSDRLIESNRHLEDDEPMASPHVPGSGVQGLRSEDGWLDIAGHSEILDMVSQLIGPDVILWGSTLFPKPPGTGRIVPWHRDGRYWPIKPLATTSVWIAVEGATRENGCLRILRGSHRAREIGKHYRDHGDTVTIPETLQEDQYDEADAVDVLLEPGEMVIFDIYTAHGSNANVGDTRRVGYALRFMPATSHYDHHDVPVEESRGAAHHTRPLILMRGEDRSDGRNDFTIGHPTAARG